MFKVGDLATVTKLPGSANWPATVVVGDVVQITSIHSVAGDRFVGFMCLRTGEQSSPNWAVHRFDPLPSYPE